MRVLVHCHDDTAWCDALSQRLPDAEILPSSTPADQRGNIDYLAAWQPSPELLKQLPSLKGIVNLGAGVDALLNNPALPAGVPIVKLRDAGMAKLIADYVRYGVLHFQRNFDHYARQQAKQQWQPLDVIDKADWPVGVLGLGAIGHKVADAIAADGFPVHGWSRTPKPLNSITCHHGEDGLFTLLSQVQTLVLLLPDTAATRGIINTNTLAALPEGASLINPGRGPLIDETALLAALGDAHSDTPGRLRGALLDAFSTEPLPESSPLWQHPRIRITPHMSGPTPLNEALDQVAETLHAMNNGEPVETVDPQAGY
ncbi:2-hydroxyacid dehydrogenase [Halomonas halocynthiae]|uniref:2-hydroxyacid dehydrogenase n=1 Tax=Halomonas halocynthiae TaxID=176290 RepID=UPI000411A42F|nr:glyoxylate/hydroxypyruvate reductase A [Halomonas halocynthiae]